MTPRRLIELLHVGILAYGKEQHDSFLNMICNAAAEVEAGHIFKLEEGKGFAPPTEDEKVFMNELYGEVPEDYNLVPIQEEVEDVPSKITMEKVVKESEKIAVNMQTIVNDIKKLPESSANDLRKRVSDLAYAIDCLRDEIADQQCTHGQKVTQ